MRAIVTLAVLLFAAPQVAAKCADGFVLVTGTVVDAEGEPARGVSVGVSWLERGGQVGPAMALTDEEGRYSIPVTFRTYSGSKLFGGDICEWALEEVSLAAYSRSHRSRHVRLEIGSRTAVEAPVITIDTPIATEPLFPDTVGG